MKKPEFWWKRLPFAKSNLVCDSRLRWYLVWRRVSRRICVHPERMPDVHLWPFRFGRWVRFVSRSTKVVAVEWIVISLRPWEKLHIFSCKLKQMNQRALLGVSPERLRCPCMTGGRWHTYHVVFLWTFLEATLRAWTHSALSTVLLATNLSTPKCRAPKSGLRDQNPGK